MVKRDFLVPACKQASSLLHESLLLFCRDIWTASPCLRPPFSTGALETWVSLHSKVQL